MIQELEYARGVEQISHPEIASIEKPLIDLSRQILLDGIHYDLIIGDDTSGRIPTLILGRVLRDIYESVGEQTSQVRFVRGRNENREETQREVNDVLACLGEKPAATLVVTELVDSGRCLGSITGALQNREVDHNIAALFIFANPKFYMRAKSIQKGSRLFYHKQTNMLPDVWGKQRLTGLKRRADKATRVARSAYGANEVRSARLDVEIVADRILRQF